MRSEPFYGKITIGTGVSQVTSTDEKLERGLLLRSNTSTVYIGFNASVTTGNGYPLVSGSELVIPIIDPQKVYAVAATTGNDLRYMAM